MADNTILIKQLTDQIELLRKLRERADEAMGEAQAKIKLLQNPKNSREDVFPRVPPEVR